MRFAVILQSRPARLPAALILPALLLGAWQIAATQQWLDGLYFPPPLKIWDALWRPSTDHTLVKEGATTVARAIKGWVIGGAIGAAVGLALSRSQSVERAVAPTLEFMRSFPAPVIVPVALLFLGVGERMEVTVVAFAALWPVLINTTVGARSTEPLLIDAARVFHMSRLRQASQILLPSALPSILVGLRISLAVSLVVAVVAEMLGSGAGLGNLIIEASSRFQIPNVYAIVVVLGVIGVAVNAAVQYSENWLTRWQRADHESVLRSVSKRQTVINHARVTPAIEPNGDAVEPLPRGESRRSR